MSAAVLQLQLLVLLTSQSAAPAAAFVSRCSACEAVASEVLVRLDNETEHLDIDLMGRLDPNGKRMGKRIPYKYSELRVFELLEPVCEVVHERYGLSLRKPKKWQRTDWMEASKRDEWRTDAKKRGQRDALRSYCVELLDDRAEEGLSRALLRDEKGTLRGPGELRRLLCRKLTRDCPKNAKSPKEPASAFEDGPDGQTTKRGTKESDKAETTTHTKRKGKGKGGKGKGKKGKQGKGKGKAEKNSAPREL